MREDDSGTENLIAFPGKAGDDASDDARSAHPRDRDLIRRLEAIATTIGVPVSTFLDAAREGSAAAQGSVEDGPARPSETAELLELFGRISDGRMRDQCLSLMRMLAAGGPEAEPSR